MFVHVVNFWLKKSLNKDEVLFFEKEVQLLSENIISLLKNKKDAVNKAALISALKQIIKK